MSKTFCILPWIHAQTKPNGQIKPCCRFDFHHESYLKDGEYVWDKFNVYDTSLSDALASSEWESVRQKMLDGQEVTGCWKCYKEEVNDSSRSMRRGMNTIWNKNTQDSIDTDPGLKYLELALGNYCNLKCRTCGGFLSSTWTDEENILSKFYKDRHLTKGITHSEYNLNPQDFINVEEIKFTGGEPMLHPNFIKILDIIINNGNSQNVTLDIFTNASWVPKYKILSRLKKFKKIKINLSIDGIEKTNDYIRAPSQWETVEKSTIEWLKQDEQIFHIKWAPTFCIYNVLEATKMIDWWLDLQQTVKGKDFISSVATTVSRPGKQYKQLNMVFNLVYQPNYLSPSLLPDKRIVNDLRLHKENLLQQVKHSKLADYDRYAIKTHINSCYQKLITNLEGPVDFKLIQTFAEYTTDLDNIRNESLQYSIPNLYNQFTGIVNFKGRMNE